MFTVIGLVNFAIATTRPLVTKFFKKLSCAFATFVESRVHNAVPDWQLRRVREDMRRFDRLVLASTAHGRDRTARAARRLGTR
jgi:hypothetical protein